MAKYDITALGSALEFDTTNNSWSSSYRLPGLDRVVVAWQLSTSVIRVQAFNVNKSTGAVTAIGSPLEINNGTASDLIRGLSLTVIDASNLALFTAGDADDGFCQLLSVDGTGNISTNGSVVEYDTTAGYYSSSVLMDETHILNVWGGASEDGFACIFTVDTGAGTITKTGTAFEFDTTMGVFNNLTKLSTTKAVVFYRGALDDGFSVVLSVNTTTWAVTAGGSAFEFKDTTTIQGNDTVLMSDGSPMVVINAWCNSDTTLQSYIQSFNINTSTWAITAFGSELELGGTTSGAGYVNHITLKKVDATHVIAWYAGSGIDGFVGVYTLNQGTGALTATGTPLEFDTVNSASKSSIDFTETPGFFVCVWGGSGNDGYIQSFQVDMTSLSTGNFFKLF